MVLKVTFYFTADDSKKVLFCRSIAVENTILYLDDKPVARFQDWTWGLYGDPTPWTGFKVEGG
jgi:hypothetical protein